MIYKKRKIICVLIAAIMIVAASFGTVSAETSGTRTNNVTAVYCTANISNGGLLQINNRYVGIEQVTTKCEITTYVEKKVLGLFWTRVNIGEPNNEWVDTIYGTSYYGTHTCQLQATGTYRVTAIFVVYGTGGAPDRITRVVTRTY